MSIWTRLAIYAAFIVLGTVLVTWRAVAESNARLEYDKSAMAWVGFLPFIVPIFSMYAAAAVVPVAAIIEVVLAVWRRR